MGIKNVLHRIVKYKVIELLSKRRLVWLEWNVGQWENPTNSPDVYKEKWFHGKISRDEVRLEINEWMNEWIMKFLSRLNFYYTIVEIS